MGAVEFIATNLNILERKFARSMLPKEWNWCKYLFLYRAEFSLVGNEIYVYTRDFSDIPDDYYLSKEEQKTFYIVPKDYDKSRHFSFAQNEVTKDEFINEYKKRKGKK
ncbi:hypothetical protein IJ674_10345 [bacterium]|nr:hypothetical protein [bacterium]